MHIRHAIYIEATPARAMEAARAWMGRELHELGGEITEGVSASGATSITSTIDQDGILMTTSLEASPHGTGARLILDLRTQGIDFGAKVRNIGLFPGRKLVSSQARASLQEIKATAEGGQ